MSSSSGFKRKREGNDDEDLYLSDESAFYGDEATKQELEYRALIFSPREWWADHTPSLIEIARDNLRNSEKPKPVTLYNPYGGPQYANSARQLGETVEEFLERLPPETTPILESRPWIYIANPSRHSPGKAKVKREVKEEGEHEAPMTDDSSLAEFVRQGGRLLEELTSIRHQIEKDNPGKAKGTITKKLTPRKDEIVERLLKKAVELKVTGGKWMIFCDPQEVNDVWAIIAKGTLKDELGTAAKVAPDSGEERQHRLICVYTKDFTDMKDVTRIAAKLKEYGMIGGRGIYYKCDAYTYLGLGSGNEYNIKASMYSSIDLLKNGKGKDSKIEGFFSRKNRDERDWKVLEN